MCETEMQENVTYKEELLDYVEDDENVPGSAGVKVNGEAVKKSEQGVSKCKFIDFPIKFIVVVNVKFLEAEEKVVLEVGCGAGNTIFPFVMSQTYVGEIFVLSAVSPEKMPMVLQNIRKIMKVTDDQIDEVIIGTDVTYVAEAIIPLFQTARELISTDGAIIPLFQTARELISTDGGDEEEGSRPALILCHIFRRVDEASILSAASCFGFRLVDRWPNTTTEDPYRSIISSWFEGRISEEDIENPALNIMYFHANCQVLVNRNWAGP
ncbi:hypothetical protein L6452_22353 [Arctium lappa]|uniref:Uncharacterized protein n=1 Tax=Arctium lappa TaxID=4217 RepID=A0ACB9AYP9_ARCLA|nr:hypothetical protein L6452_22353 [Arctium lappa]